MTFGERVRMLRREAEKIAAVTQSFESVLNPMPGKEK